MSENENKLIKRIQELEKANAVFKKYLNEIIFYNGDVSMVDKLIEECLIEVEYEGQEF